MTQTEALMHRIRCKRLLDRLNEIRPEYDPEMGYSYTLEYGESYHRTIKMAVQLLSTALLSRV